DVDVDAVDVQIRTDRPATRLVIRAVEELKAQVADAARTDVAANGCVQRRPRRGVTRFMKERLHRPGVDVFQKAEHIIIIGGLRSAPPHREGVPRAGRKGGAGYAWAVSGAAIGVNLTADRQLEAIVAVALRFGQDRKSVV